MSEQESLQCSTKASLAYTSAHPERKAKVFPSHQKVKNRFLPFLLSCFVYSHFSTVPFSALSLSAWSNTIHFHILQYKVQGTTPSAFPILSQRGQHLLLPFVLPVIHLVTALREKHLLSVVGLWRDGETTDCNNSEVSEAGQITAFFSKGLNKQPLWPEMLWMPHHWKCLRVDSKGVWAAWCSTRHTWEWWVAGSMWYLRLLPTQTILGNRWDLLTLDKIIVSDGWEVSGIVSPPTTCSRCKRTAFPDIFLV